MEASARMRSIRKRLGLAQRLHDDAYGGTLLHDMTEPDESRRVRRAFALNPVLPVEELRAAEGKLGVLFPEEYAAFLTTLGDGGRLLYSLRQVLLEGLPRDLQTPFTADSYSGYIEIEGDYDVDYWLIVSGRHRGEVWASESRLDDAGPRRLHAGLLDYYEARLANELATLRLVRRRMKASR
jgi:hypothetical protein